MRIKNLILVGTVLAGTVVTSCNSNDDGVDKGIEIPGITITDDIDCCSAEEALQVYNFLQTVKIVPELSISVDGKYNVFAYTPTGGLHVGYNDIYFVATKKSSGNYIKKFDITGITPVMLMSQMNMKHSTPVSGLVEIFNDNYLAVKHGWLSLVMATSENGSWSLSYDADILGKHGKLDEAAIDVNALPSGQVWLKSFKSADKTYYISLVNPTLLHTGKNELQAYVSVKSQTATVPYTLALEQFIIETNPRMPDMGNHTSPDNTSLTLQEDGSYKAAINLTMTGLWRIHLTVRDLQGNVIAGGDDLKDGFSSLYFDVTI